MLISILTGLVAGSIHVVGGADHIAAMAPVILRDQRVALRNGLAWGLGHSSGVLILSVIAILAKDLVHIQAMSSVAEFIVGIALLIVGALAIRTSFGVNIHAHSHSHRDGRAHEHIHFHLRGHQRHARHTHAATSLGVLHGLAGASHFLAVLPALALPPLGALLYMAAYLFGSILSMGVFTLILSRATMRISQRSFPLVIGFAGGVSIATGLVWIQKTAPFLG